MFPPWEDDKFENHRWWFIDWILSRIIRYNCRLNERSTSIETASENGPTQIIFPSNDQFVTILSSQVFHIRRARSISKDFVSNIDSLNEPVESIRDDFKAFRRRRSELSSSKLNSGLADPFPRIAEQWRRSSSPHFSPFIRLCVHIAHWKSNR